MQMCACLWACTQTHHHVHIRTYTHTHAFTHTFSLVFTCVYAHAHKHTHTYTLPQSRIFLSFMCKYIHVRAHTHTLDLRRVTPVAGSTLIGGKKLDCQNFSREISNLAYLKSGEICLLCGEICFTVFIPATNSSHVTRQKRAHTPTQLHKHVHTHTHKMCYECVRSCTNAHAHTRTHV